MGNTISVQGDIALGRRVNSIIKKIDREPDATIMKAVNEGTLHGIMNAPKRTGKTALSIKQGGSKNNRYIFLSPLTPAYNVLIDQGRVSPMWGQRMGRGMIDKRTREEKLYFFKGTNSKPGKTLTFLLKNFPGLVKELSTKIMLKGD